MTNKLKINPWKEIWFKPRATIRAIVDFNPKYCLFLFYMIFGILAELDFAQKRSLIDSIPLWSIVLAALMLSPFIGAFGICLGAWLLSWTGKWMGGKGNFSTVRAAIAWSHVPSIVTVGLWGILVSVFGSQLFVNTFEGTVFVGYEACLINIVFLVKPIISVWGFILLLKTLGEVQGFSGWRALLNVILAIIPLVLILMLIAMVIWAIFCI